MRSTNDVAAGGGGRRRRVALISFEFAEICVALANGLARHADVCLVLPEEQVEELRADASDRKSVV